MLKIGLLIHDFQNFENWEISIIKFIKNNSDLQLSLIIKGGKYVSPSVNRKQPLSFLLLHKQISLEKKRYLHIKKTAKTENIIHYLKTISSIDIKPKLDGDIITFNIEDSNKVKEHDLDIILEFGFHLISGDILKAAKHGIWFLSHSLESLKKGGLPGFWEVLNKEDAVCVSLLKLLPETGKAIIIDKAFFNIDRHSSIITNNTIKELSVALLFNNLKKINKLEKTDSYELIGLTSINKQPHLYEVSKYILNFYTNVFRNRINNIIPLPNNNAWTLMIGEGNFMDADLTKLKSVDTPKDEFWADPFLFKYENQYFVFFEVYSFKKRKGKISCGKVKNNELVDIVDVLDLEYHLSYPFIFEENGDIFLMPETGQNSRLEIYKCIDFPKKWVLFTTAFEGENIVDPFFYCDNKNQKWLFVNKNCNPDFRNSNMLFIYKVDSVKLNTLIPHDKNPIIIDSRSARNGGAIFKFKNNYYRPSQRNINGFYGKKLNINLIKELTLHNYKEEIVEVLIPENFSRIHHLHQTQDMFVIDVVLKKSSFFD